MAAQGMHQSQNLSLQQVLAPQLQQSLLILQAPLLELRNLVQQEMETNPVLEELATDPDNPSTTESAASDQEFKEEFDKLAKLDEEWRDYMAQSGSYSARAHEDEEKRQFFFDSIATTETLQQHLMSQLNQQVLNALAPHLEGEKFPQALQAALTLQNKGWRGQVLRALVLQLEGEQLQQALQAALALQDEDQRAQVLNALEILGAGAADHAANVIAPVQKQLGQVTTVLPGDARDERCLP